MRRRYQVLAGSVLDAYFVKMGQATIEYTTYFVSPGVRLPPSYIQSASRAYLYADTLMDLEHDLRLGIINIPAEDIEPFRLDLRAGGDTLRHWVTTRSAAVEQYYREALRETARLDNFRIRLLSRLYLFRKRRRFRAFLEQMAIAPGRGAAPETWARQPSLSG